MKPATERQIDKNVFFERVGYRPHPQQLLYHNSRARFRAPVCGRRFGKSMMAGNDLAPKLFIPDKRFWIVGPTYDLGEKEFRVVWDTLIVKMQMGRDKRVKKAYNKKTGTMNIQMPWNTLLEVRSADHPENLVGESLDGAIMSEAAKHKQETWERFIRPALTDRRGFADFPTTPEGFNWLHEIWQYGQRTSEEFQDYESWRFPSWMNSAIYPLGREDPEIKLLEATTVPEWFMQEIGADFASFVGKIFPEWDEMVNVKQHTYRPDWPNYMAFDWGYTNPLAAIEFQVSPRDEIFVWREHYQSFTILRDHLELMSKREQPEGYKIDLAFGDSADPEAVAYVSQDLVPCVAMPEAKENWREGIDLMRSFMKPRPTGDQIDEYGTPAPDEPAFYVDPDCKKTIHEFNNYRSNEPIKGKNVPEFGRKMDDHTIDAIRYGLVHIYNLGATSSLADVYRPAVRAGAPKASNDYIAPDGPPGSLNRSDLDLGGNMQTHFRMDGMDF